MSHRFLLTLVILALGVGTASFYTLAQANPLAGARNAAQDSRAASEAKSQQVAQAADGHAGDAHDMVDQHAHQMNRIDHAIAVLSPTEGHDVQGSIMFAETENGVRVTARVTGLDPNASHGFHIHEFGDISAPDGKAAGGHYNPEGHDHALPENADTPRHAGDLGNLQADADGHASFDMTFDNISIAGLMNPILGRGLIVHAQKDDGGQPTGNAGPRIAQAVVGIAQK